MLMVIKVDKNTCIGCGLCESICEDVFEVDNDGKAQVKKQSDDPCVNEAVEQCPVEAISKS